MYSKRKIALLDCNNFYVSCERLFRPDLKNKPVAVLSNNDGCIIARSNEVKKIGITWEYVHNVRQKLQQNNVTLFSSNYNLYGDISDRIMTIIKSHFKNIEIYSIDEAFFDCTELDESEVIDKLLALRKQILKWTGVPVSIGVGPNKTIAKLMNHIAKKRQKYNGVCYFENLKNKERYVEINIEKVWGVGKQTVLKLQKLNIKTIQQFLQLSESQVKYIFTITGLRTYLELKQQYILLLNKKVKNKKEIMTSRTFGKEVTSIDELQTALHYFLNKGCIKLKRQNLLVKKVVIFFETNPYKPYYIRYKQQQTLEFATNDNEIIWTQLQYLIHLIFNPKRNYKKAGILLYDLTTTVQLSLFQNQNPCYTYQKVETNWPLHAQFLSSRYTSDWNQLAIIKNETY